MKLDKNTTDIMNEIVKVYKRIDDGIPIMEQNLEPLYKLLQYRSKNCTDENIPSLIVFQFFTILQELFVEWKENEDECDKNDLDFVLALIDEMKNICTGKLTYSEDFKYLVEVDNIDKCDDES